MNRHPSAVIHLTCCVTFFTFSTWAVHGENGESGTDGEQAVDALPQSEIPPAPPPGTDVVPHLHAPIMPGRNVIYSAGFQLVWNTMWDRFTKQAPKLEPASDLAASLNLRGIEEADISPESVFITCGYVHEDVVERVRREMSARFPGSRYPISDPTPDEGGPPRILIHAQLEKTLAFENRFMPVPKAVFRFIPEDWSAASVSMASICCFGLEPVPHPASEQVKIHYFHAPLAETGPKTASSSN